MLIHEAAAAIFNLRNVAIDHKKTCDHNCNVSLTQLRTAAKLILSHVRDEELDQAEQWIKEMPIG